MLGLDTVSLHLPAEYISDSTAAALADHLTKEVADSATGAVWQGGHVGNLRLSMGESGLRITGSLATYFYGDNTEPLHRRDVPQAIERLSAVVGADVSAAEVRRADVAATLMTRHTPAAYLPILGSAPRFTRLATAPTSLEYRRGKAQTQVLAFYDKGAECRARHKEMPTPYQAVGNCLRYEFRLMRQPARQLGLPSLTLGQLADKDIFGRLVGLWKDSYFTINKTYKNTDVTAIKTPREAIEYLLSTLLAETGGAERVDSFLADIKAQSVFSNRQDYTRLKTQLKSIQNKCADKADASGGNLARELDEAVYNEVAYY